jgi:8-oxo-dGTP pyrophosphatase MutT (NUDIX family)
MDLGDGTPASPIPSATVLMLRDAPAGLEVFLLERHGLSDVLGGAYVFPGGKLDRADAELGFRLDQPGAALREALAEPELDEDHAAALYVAAIREAFEESGVLFAAIGEDGLQAAQAQYRARRDFREVVEGLGVPLAAARLLPWSRWVTPLNSVRARKHFDARFFVAAVPPGQEPVHDDHEATQSVWLSPAKALCEYWEGRIQLAPPQIMSLGQLARFRDVGGVLGNARSRKPPRIQPEVFLEGGVNMVCYPGDPRHSVPESLLPGPTRLCWRSDRYEPEDGLDALLG